MTSPPSYSSYRLPPNIQILFIMTFPNTQNISEEDDPLSPYQDCPLLNLSQ